MTKTRARKGRNDSTWAWNGAQDDLALKKEVWQMCICERKSAASVAQLEAIDAETVQAFCDEVEFLRSSLGLHWSWFQEELTAGKYDSQLENGRQPEAPELNFLMSKDRRNPPCRKPLVASPKVEKIQIPQEVWLAAGKNRKANFLAKALLSPPPKLLFSLLTFLEVSEVLDLAMAARGLAGALLDFAWEATAKEGALLWKLLGARGSMAARPSFAGDPAFRLPAWARRRRFFERLGRGVARVAQLVTVPELGPSRLGPFLSNGRLLVFDRQTCRVLDVQRRQRDEVEIDRYGNKRLLFSSAGIHPAEVTTSWPLEEAPHCCAMGGIVAARPSGLSSCALQWLELPNFERGINEDQSEATRSSLRQDQLAASLGEAEASLCVAEVWPLPDEVLLLVHVAPSSPKGGLKSSPVAKAKGGGPTERQDCGSRWWLQVWHLDSRKELLPRVQVKASKVTCVHTASIGGKQLLLCGAEGEAQLLELSTFRVLQEWREGLGQSRPMSRVLLRSEAEQPVAVLAQTGGVFLAKMGQKPERLLPAEGFGDIGEALLEPVGAEGFAVCANGHVYAFEDGALSSVIELPQGEVRQFLTTPYEFFVAVDADGPHKPRAVCCQWPSETDEAGSSAFAVNLRAWHGGVETSAAGLDLAKVLTNGRQVRGLALREGLSLAVNSEKGVAVFDWATEVSPALEDLRAIKEQRLLQEAQLQRQELLRRQLLRCQQRLQETEKLEEKATRGEALSEDELAKVARRPQVEAEIDRLTHELGLASHSEGEEEVDPEEEREANMARRREKEKVQRRHHEEKRVIQKERQKNRDRKFSE